MSVKHYGIFVAYAPGVHLHTEGLGRLLAAFLRAASRRQELRFTIVCPSWSRADLLDLLRQEGGQASAFTLVTPSRLPLSLRLYAAYRRWSRRRSPRPRRLSLLAGWARAQVSGMIGYIASELVTARSLWTYAAWILMGTLLALVLTGPLLGWLIGRVLHRGARWLGRRSAVTAARSVLAQLLTAPARLPWAVKLYQQMLQHEIDAMVLLVDRQAAVRCWFSPTAFWPEICRIRAPHLICVPDVVVAEAAVGFGAIDASGRYGDTLERIESTLGTGKAFTTYSNHIAQSVLAGRYGVPRERTTVIPHASVRLDRWVAVSGFPDNEATSRTHCQRMLRVALTKATQQPYATLFLNTDVRFIFYASQFRPSKNILGLLRVYERLLRRRFIGHKLFLTGNPTHLPEIAAFIAHHRLTNDVLFMPNLSASELAACFKLADLAVNPTFSEGGCPFTLTEALSVGTPVVMSAIAVTTEIITDPALQQLMLFDPRNLDQMEERILWAITHRDELLAAQMPLFRRLAERTWDHVVDEHVLAMERAVQAREIATG